MELGSTEQSVLKVSLQPLAAFLKGVSLLALCSWLSSFFWYTARRAGEESRFGLGAPAIHRTPFLWQARSYSSSEAWENALLSR